MFRPSHHFLAINPSTLSSNTDVLPGGCSLGPSRRICKCDLAGRTITRPEFRCPQLVDDVTNRRSVRGNPEVNRGTIDHYDARWEWYLSPQQVISLAAFYKQFTDPIETMVTCGADRTITFRNSPEARNLGAEVSFRKDFQEVGAQWLYLTGNFALISSSVDLTGAMDAKHHPDGLSVSHPMSSTYSLARNMRIQVFRAPFCIASRVKNCPSGHIGFARCLCTTYASA